jgi:acetoin utilization deacetylase AcuC-like enzyme
MTATALAYDPRCLDHDNGSMLLDPTARSWLDVPHAESPARVARAKGVLDESGIAGRLDRLEVRPAEDEDYLLVHSRAHVKAIRDACRSGEVAWVGPEARVGPGTGQAAALSAGAALAAVDWACEQPGGRAYSLTRPPGHHASRDRAMGFCLFNNVALAARRAQRAHGVERVAIVDWDVHHGNGTQDVFYEDPDVLFVSLHQAGLYPADTGTLGERGSGAGEGTTVNLPLPPGSGDAGYLAACADVVVPELRRFQPELILVSCGQDAAASDPLGRMSVTTEGFRGMMRSVVEVADELCEGRLVAVQEGGYSVDHMPFCVLASVEALAGFAPTLPHDPMELDVTSAITEAEQHALVRAAEVHGAAPRRTS